MFDDAFDAIDSQPVNRWRTELTPDEVSILEVMAGKWMERLEYPLYGKHPIGTKLRVLKQKFRAVRWDSKSTLMELIEELKGGS